MTRAMGKKQKLNLLICYFFLYSQKSEFASKEKLVIIRVLHRYFQEFQDKFQRSLSTVLVGRIEKLIGPRTWLWKIVKLFPYSHRRGWVRYLKFTILQKKEQSAERSCPTILDLDPFSAVDSGWKAPILISIKLPTQVPNTNIQKDWHRLWEILRTMQALVPYPRCGFRFGGWDFDVPNTHYWTGYRSLSDFFLRVRITTILSSDMWFDDAVGDGKSVRSVKTVNGKEKAVYRGRRCRLSFPKSGFFTPSSLRFKI